MKKKQEIIDLMNGDHPVLLHFYSTDCTKHKANKTTLRELIKKQLDKKLHTVNIEIKKQPQLVEDLGIDGSPAVVLFACGEEVWRWGGAVSELQIEQALNRLTMND